MIPMVIEEVRRLNQEEGLFDEEIGIALGVSRATINRCRRDNGIPLANLSNRKDKTYKCQHCAETIVVARKERKKWYCGSCRQKFIEIGVWNGPK